MSGAVVIHFYYGDNELALKRQLAAVVEKFAAKYGQENVARLDAETMASDQVLAELVNVGLFAAKRLIILSGAFASKELLGQLPDVLPRVPDESELVVVESRPDRRTKLFKALQKYQTKELSLPRNLVNFVADEAHNNRVEIKREAIDELIIYTAGDPWRMAAEIAKLKPLDQVVTVELIHQHVEPDLTASAFKLLDDLLGGRRDQAIVELAKLRLVEDPNKFLGLIASQIFALAAAVNAGGRSGGDVARDMGLHPYVVSKVLTAARGLTPAEVARMASLVAATDVKLKSTGADPWTLIELLVAKL
jgi:DNA polymerase-3 subunit delta